MKTVVAFLLVVSMSLALAVLSSGDGNAQQAPGNSSTGQSPPMEIKDTVVNPYATVDRVPVTNVYWRGRYYRSWPGRYSWRPYRYGGYYYGYRVPRCWWNGYRWICKPKRVIIY
jgi:hypothetical protein